MEVEVIAPILGLGIVHTGCLLGLDLLPVTVEVASRRGPALFQMAGLAEAAVKEARIRVGSAVSRIGLNLDEYSLTVSLAPADLRKSGSALDLALALAVLVAVGRLKEEVSCDTLVLGEVGLDGSIRGVPGVLPLLEGARKCGYRRALVPSDNAREAAQVAGLTVRAVGHLETLIEHLTGKRTIAPLVPEPFVGKLTRAHDLADIAGQASPKRALAVAAAGGHNLLLSGPPGSGKSMLAARLPGLLPPLSLSEALQATAIHSVSGLLSPTSGILTERPFRAPHHTVSEAGLIGGGSTVRPGEISLAHHGVLFLDELPEFHRSVLESLRQPLEDGQVHIVRAKSRILFPAAPLLVGAMNPCPCGHYGNPRVACRCSTESRRRYVGRISGPLLERLDLLVQVPPVDVERLAARTRGQPSAEVRVSVEQARRAQRARFETGEVTAPLNRELGLAELERVAELGRDGKKLLEEAVRRLGLSARGFVRVLRVARTIADLSGVAKVEPGHLAEAIGYRSLDWAFSGDKPKAGPRSL
jgi:magnesium chelatase family protein